MLRERLARGTVDSRSFRRPLARCDISHCRGMCCYDGVYVSEASAAVISDLAKNHAAFFAELGLEIPPRVIVEGNWAGRSDGLKTAVRPHPFSQGVEGYPRHFTDTACVFLVADGRCSLQVLSERLGRHPWFYKPVKCWMHPMTLGGQAKDVLLLHSKETDPYRLPQYDGFVSTIFCGRTCPGGAPASEVLVPELTFLSRIVGRDFLAEVRQNPESNPVG
ncbi:MAG TPA: hypothetical protein VLG48_06655, partial [Candidatus Methylomirabilis sp.]|nr:hypothetical protein [Candidatus Methylomirabilis sp.]